METHFQHQTLKLEIWGWLSEPGVIYLCLVQGKWASFASSFGKQTLKQKWFIFMRLFVRTAAFFSIWLQSIGRSVCLIREEEEEETMTMSILIQLLGWGHTRARFSVSPVKIKMNFRHKKSQRFISFPWINFVKWRYVERGERAKNKC